MKVISYNLRKHRAAGELAHLVERHGADVLCLQEADTSDIPEEISGLRLADSTQRNRLGLAVYYRENTDRIVASFHAAPLTALNSLRRHQIRTALGELQQLGGGLPALMVGDYNYPVFKERLGQHIREQGYELNLSDSRTYTRYRFFRGHYDFATSVGFEIDRVRTLPQGLSDHLPILVTARPAAGVNRTVEVADAESGAA